tara:strand:+ start:1347 stop:2183 length:837 start_codon:yes stop_codon:yes gene_type:complete
MHSEKITILLPIYKPKMRFLKETLLSILNQTLEKRFFKLFIINDSLNDKERMTINQFLDDRIKFSYIDVERGNIAKSLQKGLSQVNTKYFARIDADDIMENVRLKEQLEYIEKDNQIAVLGSRICFIDEESKQINNLFSNLLFPTNNLLFLMVGSFYNNPVAHPSVICRTDYIKECGGFFQQPPSEDYWLWSLVIKNKKIINLSSVLTRYRIHKSQLTRKESLSYKNRIRIRLRFWKALFVSSFIGQIFAILLLPLIFIPLKLSHNFIKSLMLIFKKL